jgi:ABC-2 type transport system permease protein
MNASIQEPAAMQPRAATADAYGFGSKFKLLLRREFWENKGGFFWAPVITGIIASVFAVIGLIIATIFIQKAKNDGDFHDHFKIDDVDGLQAFGIFGDGILANGMALSMLVMIFVVFFYALGSLYDERRDRSVLFWKSLPVSDMEVVLSKAAWALVLAPTLALLIGVIIGFAMWLIAAAGMAVNGVPGMSALFTESNPLRVIGQFFGVLPVYIMWAVPTVGWLMLCSAWSRRFPFLWAVLVPLLGCAMVSMTAGIFSGLTGAEFPHGDVWYVVVVRGLAGLIPGLWYATAVDGEHAFKGIDDVSAQLDLTSSWGAFATLDMWLGVAIGVGMIFLAIRLRRWRDEG